MAMHRSPVPVARSIMRGAIARPSHHRGQRILASSALLSTAAGGRRGPENNISTTSKTLSGSSSNSSSSSSSSVTAARQDNRSTPRAEDAGTGNPELPSFSLDGLGVSRNMKIFLILVLSIFGTMETWLYCKAIWRWWYGGQPPPVKGEDK